MQIHELTKRRKQRTDEAGLLKGITNAINAAKTGYTAAKGATGSTLAGVGKALGTLGQAATSPGFAAQSSKEANSAAGVAKYNELAKKYGWEPMQDPTAPGASPTQSASTQQQTQAPQQQVQAMVQQFTQDPMFVDLTAVLPDPGQLLRVEIPNPGGSPAEYFKDESGTWRTKDGLPIKGSAKKLESMIDADQYSQVSAAMMGGGQQQDQQQGTGKVKKQKQGTATTAATTPPAPPGTQQVQEAVGNRKVQNIVKKIIQKNRAAEQAAQKAAENPKAKPVVDQAYNKVLAAAAQTKSQAPTRQAKAASVKRAFTNYAKQVVQASAGAPEGDQAQASTAQSGQDQGSQASPVQKQQAAKTVTTKAGVDGNKLATSIATDPQVKQAVTTMTKESRKPLTQQLEEAIQMLNEAQVAITKDIRIRTTKGDYVKRASDQTWYDPNGVPIDPVKYADYVKKLDATPQAQTQYQADAQNAAKGKGPGGTDAGAQKAAQTPPPPPPPQAPAAAPAPQPDPLQQMADQQKMQQWLRGRDVAGLNAQIKDTTAQLRNAQIFGTGQEDYLKQQLAQLIALKV